MDVLWKALLVEVGHVIPDAQTFARVFVRLGFAILLTSIIGWERERGRKTAGLRTHLMVAIGSALFVLVLEDSVADQGVSRVIQGVTTGVGFIGGGAILKLESQNRIRGLTTAGSLWFAAAIGVAAGTGKLAAAIVGTFFAFFVLSIVAKIELIKRKPDIIVDHKNPKLASSQDAWEEE